MSPFCSNVLCDFLIPVKLKSGILISAFYPRLLLHRPLPPHPSAEKSPSLRGFPKQPRVRWKSKGQNPEFWPAGPALLLALCRPACPGAPARMGKGRVRELHPGGRRGSKEGGRALYCPLMADRICGCPAAWAFSLGPCAIKVYR